MKNFITIILLVLLSISAFPQKIISGKSQPKRFVINPTFVRGIPPNLYISMDFVDQDNDGLLEAEESAMLTLTITNKGSGNAQGLKILVKDSQSDPALIINDGRSIPFLAPNKSIEVKIPITAKRDIKEAEHKMEISVSEHFGYNADPAFLMLNTFAFQEPELVFSGLEIVDIGEGTGAIKVDGQLQAGEMVKAKIVVQNIGQNIAPNTIFSVTSNDNDIYLANNSGKLGDLGIGEVKEFWITVSPNKRVANEGKLPIYLSLKNDYGVGNMYNFNLPVQMNQKPPEPKVLAIKPNENKIKNIARFEYNSSRITANIGNIIDIKQVPPSKTIRKDAIAIIIGVEKYKNFIDAPYASNDARIIKEYFKNVLGISQVIAYTDKQVTGFFFDDTFNPYYGELQKAIIKGKTEVFVFYSGHGMPSKDGDKIFLFPYDGRIEAIETQGFNLNKFYTDLDALDAKNVTIFIDACFSGVSRASENYKIENLISMKGVAIKPKITQPWESNPNFTVFSSSAFDQTSLGFDDSETGLFTYSLCAGLQGKADENGDKKITSGELADYVQKKVKELSVKIHGLQTPQFNGNRNIVLGEY